jgi:hypothetical protein
VWPRVVIIRDISTKYPAQRRCGENDHMV